MGVTKSRQSVQTQKNELNELRERIDRHLHWIALYRNGAASLLAAATVFMFLAVLTPFSQGPRAAAILVILAWILQLKCLHHREPIIQGIKTILDTHYTSSANMQGDTLFYFALIFPMELYAVAIGFGMTGARFYQFVYTLFAGVDLLVLTSLYVAKIVWEKNDYDLKDACVVCATFLEHLLRIDKES